MKTFKALGEDLSDLAKGARKVAGEVKKSALEKTAEAVGYVKEEGGVSGVASKTFRRTAGAVGTAAGHVGKAGKATYDTIADAFRGPETTEEIGKCPESITGVIAEMYNETIADFSRNYQGSKIDPNAVSEKFEKAAKQGTGVVDGVWGKIREGKDAVSKALSRYIPSEEDYIARVGNQEYQIGKNVYTKQELKKVQRYVASVGKALPRSYKGRREILAKVAGEGIRSKKELREKEPELYMTIQKYITKKRR